MKNIKIKSFRYGELFSGPGGLSYGAVNSSIQLKEYKYIIEHVWASDYDSDSCATYIQNICPDNPNSVYNVDVSNLEIDNLPPIEIFAYGFPCNDFSNVGKKNGINGKFGPLYSYGVKVLNIHSPLCFVAENVGGIRSADAGNTFVQILNDLSKAGFGYDLTIHLYKSEEYGIAQTRHRIIIVGFRKDLGVKFKVPYPNHINKFVSVKDALEIPPIRKNAFNNELTNQSKQVVERLKYIKPGENVWSATLPSHLQLNVKSAKLSQIYKRLDPHKPSYTITGSGGGGTHVYHWSENRALTNRERARIQSFPDNYIFLGSKESVRKQIGMAVPPKLSKIIFTSILRTLVGISYKSYNNGNLDYLLNSVTFDFAE